MQRRITIPERPDWRDVPAYSPVQVRPADGLLEVKFAAGSQPSDVDIVRTIPGHRWVHDGSLCLVPHTRMTEAALRRLLGYRVVFRTALGPGDPSLAPRASAVNSAPAEQSGAAASTDAAARKHDASADADQLRHERAAEAPPVPGDARETLSRAPVVDGPPVRGDAPDTLAHGPVMDGPPVRNMTPETPSHAPVMDGPPVHGDARDTPSHAPVVDGPPVPGTSAAETPAACHVRTARNPADAAGMTQAERASVGGSTRPPNDPHHALRGLPAKDASPRRKSQPAADGPRENPRAPVTDAAPSDGSRRQPRDDEAPRSRRVVRRPPALDVAGAADRETREERRDAVAQSQPRERSRIAQRPRRLDPLDHSGHQPTDRRDGADRADRAPPRAVEKIPGGPPSLLDDAAWIVDELRQAIRVRDYSRKTEIAYVAWVERFLKFHAVAVDRADQLTGAHASAYLEHLAGESRLAARSRNQAASALGFMFREILGRDEMAGVARAKGPTRLPAVLSHREVLRVLRELQGKYFLIGVLLYSAGLRLEECLRMRVKDIDFELRQILVRDGKGRKDRYVPLARRAMDLLRAQLRRVAELHEHDRARGEGWAPLPGALHRKDPQAGFELGWQWVFAASTSHPDPATGLICRWPLHATAMQRVMKAAVRRSGIPKRASCHTLRHSFATEALRGGCDIRTLQHVMGHRDIRTTMIYLHVVEQTGLYIRSPLDRPDDPEDDELDPLGSPFSRSREQWDLAARRSAASPDPRAAAQKHPTRSRDAVEEPHPRRSRDAVEEPHPRRKRRPPDP